MNLRDNFRRYWFKLESALQFNKASMYNNVHNVVMKLKSSIFRETTTNCFSGKRNCLQLKHSDLCVIDL